MTLECVRLAQKGDAQALDVLVKGAMDKVYPLALRFLWHPEDAADATQEILIKLMVGLKDFRAECAWTTWVWRVASRFLCSEGRRRSRLPPIRFKEFEVELAENLDLAIPTGVDEALLEQEVKVGCLQGMLQCLDVGHRLAYLLGEILEIPGPEASEILEIQPSLFRKRLSRARLKLHTFLQKNCGWVESNNPCRCSRKAGCSVAKGRVNPGMWLFAQKDQAEILSGIEKLQAASYLFRNLPRAVFPDGRLRAFRELLEREISH